MQNVVTLRYFLLGDLAESLRVIPGVSKWKQAFSVGIPNQLLVREFECCCISCMARDFMECKNKVIYLIGLTNIMVREAIKIWDNRLLTPFQTWDTVCLPRTK